MIRFKESGVTALILKVNGYRQLGVVDQFLELYVGDGTLDGTHDASGFTSMSVYMAKRTAEVISESR